MHSPRPALRATLLCALISTVLSGCASPQNAAQPQPVRKPRPTPLPAAILQIDTAPSRSTLQAGLQWLQDSERILHVETMR